MKSCSKAVTGGGRSCAVTSAVSHSLALLVKVITTKVKSFVGGFMAPEISPLSFFFSQEEILLLRSQASGVDLSYFWCFLLTSRQLVLYVTVVLTFLIHAVLRLTWRCKSSGFSVGTGGEFIILKSVKGKKENMTDFCIITWIQGGMQTFFGMRHWLQKHKIKSLIYSLQYHCLSPWFANRLYCINQTDHIFNFWLWNKLWYTRSLHG